MKNIRGESYVQNMNSQNGGGNKNKNFRSYRNGRHFEPSKKAKQHIIKEQTDLADSAEMDFDNIVSAPPSAAAKSPEPSASAPSVRPAQSTENMQPPQNRPAKNQRPYQKPPRRTNTSASSAESTVPPQDVSDPQAIPAETLQENVIPVADILPSSPEEDKVPENTVEIIGVRFKDAGKIYYFDPSGTKFEKNDPVIVETARGVEYCLVVIPNKKIGESKIVQPLKSVIRKATADDTKRYENNKLLEKEAARICEEKIAAHKLEMKLVDVEYTFDNNKLLFYFTSDGRVDFRDLVKELATIFRTRIELRQIGIRDEAKMLGGLGICGREFCCSSFLGEFTQVSIKMAKDQNLSLNSAKISGTCGRLICCLKYESDIYEDEIKKTPPVDSLVTTADGDGIIIDTNPLAGLVKVRMTIKNETVIKIYHRDDVQVTGRAKRQSGAQQNAKSHENAAPAQAAPAQAAPTQAAPTQAAQPAVQNVKNADTNENGGQK